jgi:hypothetical protein
VTSPENHHLDPPTTASSVHLSAQSRPPVYDSLAMVEPLPTFEQVLELMRSPKPPIACRVVELDGRTARRTAAVLFDGLQGWYIDDGARVEVRSSDESVLFDSEGNLQRVGPGVGGVHSNGWVKTPIEPRRMSLDRATGRVVRRDMMEERPTLVIEALGLREGEDVIFEMQVDVATGVVVQISRNDLGLVLRVETLRVGSIES